MILENLSDAGKTILSFGNLEDSSLDSLVYNAPSLEEIRETRSRRTPSVPPRLRVP